MEWPQAGRVFFDDPAAAQSECDRIVCALIGEQRRRLRRTVVIGLCGAQGSGKSSTAGRLAQALATDGCSMAVVSLDDIYYPKQTRAALARRIHPLLRTRGVPGTHDVPLGLEVIANLMSAAPDGATMLPRFDKALDDRLPEAQWETQAGRPDVVLFEGWCVGAVAQPEEALQQPVNDLERLEDGEGTWRRYVNQRLQGDYQSLFALLDFVFFLEAPSFEQVFAWRKEQESHLAARAPGARIMNDSELTRFIAHYERITRQLLAEPQADVVIELARDRTPLAIRRAGRGAAGALQYP